MYVPCGKCRACLQAHNQLWTARLNKECNSWPYVLFVTLTYNDENLPICKRFGSTFVGQTPRHSAEDLPVLSREDFKSFLIKENLEVDNNLKWFDDVDVLPYTSVSDIQGFIKRLRKRLSDAVKKYKRNVPREKWMFSCLSQKIRFYCAHELGPSTLRPHYHLIFWFSSELFANNYKEFISDSWTFGFNKSEFALSSDAASCYCAKYVNSFAHLPAIYRTEPFRPKCQFSRFPAIGTLSDSPEKIQHLFDTCSCKEVVSVSKDNTFANVEIWRYYKDKYFPKLTQFNTLSHSERIALYRAAQVFGRNEIGEYDYKVFDVLLSKHSEQFTDIYARYYRALCDSSKTDDFNPVKRWFYVSTRVLTQADVFRVSLRTYVERIEIFNSNSDYEHLKDFYLFQQDFTKENSSELLFGMYLDELNKFFVLPSEYATEYHASVLDSFGIPPDEFFGLDIKEREKQFSYLRFLNNSVGLNYVAKVNFYFDQNTKVKQKNDALGVFGSSVYNFNSLKNGNT